MKNLTFILQLVLIACFLPPISHAHADEDIFNLSLEDLQNIQVTASSLFAESELTSSSSVTVFNQYDWFYRGDRTAIDVLSHSTNAMVLPTISGVNVQVRGYAGTLSSRGSATLIDGVPLNSLQFSTSVYTVNNLQLGVLDRIEIVRGPGSALYGSDAFHSAVAYHTFTENNALMDFSVEAGDKGFYQANTRVSQPINDNLTFNMAVSTSGQGNQDLNQFYTDPQLGLLERNYPYEIGDKALLLKLHNGRSSAEWKFALTLLHNQEDHPSLSGFGALENKEDIVLGALNLSGQQTDSSIYKAELSKVFDKNLTFNVDVYTRNSESEFYQNIISPYNNEILTSRFQIEEERTGIDLQLSQSLLELNSQWALIVGYSEQKVSRYNQTLINPYTNQVVMPVTDVLAQEYNEQNISNIAFEAKTFFLNQKLILTYGARFDHYPVFGNQISPRFSVIYQPDYNSAIKFIYGEAFRAPNISEKVGINNVTGNPNLKPEEIDSFELVYMHQGESWKTELVYYQSDFNKGIAIVGNQQGLSYVNFSKQKAEGVEASFKVIAERWLFNGNMAIVKSKNKTSNNQRHTAYPEWLINLDFGYKLLSNLELSLTTRLFGNYYLGDKITAKTTVDKASTYIRYDLATTYKFNKDVKAWFNIKNLLDKNNNYPSVMNSEGGIPDIGRMFSIGMSYSF